MLHELYSILNATVQRKWGERARAWNSLGRFHGEQLTLNVVQKDGCSVDGGKGKESHKG